MIKGGKFSIDRQEWIRSWGLFWCGLLLVVGIVEWSLWRWHWNVVPDMGDLRQYFMPFWRFFRASLLRGELPLWMDAQELGFPFAYNPQCSLFYLPNYLLLLPFQIGLRLYLQLPFVVFYAGTYAFLRDARCSRPYSALGAVLLALSGVFVGLFSMTTVLHTIAWLPLLVLVFRGCLFSGTLLGSSLVLSQSFLAGAWDVWLFLIPIAALSGWWWIRNWSSMLRIGLVACGIVLPQVLMTGSYLPMTIRENVGVAESVHWSSGFHHLLGLVSPNIQHSSLGYNVWFEVLGLRPGWTLSTYLSAALVVLLPLSVLWLWSRHRLLLGYLLVLFGISMTGSIHWAVQFLEKHHFSVPIRYPDKLLPILLLAFSLFALRAFPGWLRMCASLGKRSHLAWLALLPAILLAAFPFARERFLDGSSPAYRPDVNAIVGQRLLYEYFTSRDAVVFLGMALGTIGILFLIRKYRFSMLMVLAVGIFDLVLAGTKWGSCTKLATAPSALLHRIEVGNARIAVIDNYMKNILPPPGKAQLVDLGRDESLLWLAQNFDQISDYGWRSLNGINVLPLKASRVLTTLVSVHPDSVRREIFWRTGTSWLIGDSSDLRKMFIGELECYGFASNAVACRMEGGGFARWHEKVEWTGSWTAATIRMLATVRDRNIAYVKGASAALKGLHGDAPVFRLALRGRDGRNSFHLPAGHGDGVAVIASSFHPDWAAYDQNGARLDVVEADYALIGVVVPRGVTEIRLAFSGVRMAWSLVAGIFVLSIGLLMRPHWFLRRV